MTPLKVLHDPSFLSLIEDLRWKKIESTQFDKYESAHGLLEINLLLKLFRMIIKDQGFMYAGNIERKKVQKNGGFSLQAAIYPILAMEEKNVKKIIKDYLDFSKNTVGQQLLELQNMPPLEQH